MIRTLAALFVALCLSIGTAAAQCNNPTSGYVPFNCQPGAPPQPGDLVLGGQNSQTVKWTWAQVLNPNGGLLPIATSTTLGMVRPDGTSITVSNGILTAIGGGGGGGVSSVGLVLPGIFTVTGSPVTTSGNLTAALNTVSPNLIFGGPSSGSAAGPTFRALTIADLPSGLAVPGGSTWAVQINGGAGAFSGQSLGSGQILIGQASGTPLPESITGGSLSAAGVLTYPASALTGTTLASAILNSSLTGVGTIGAGTWQGTLISPTYGGTGIAGTITGALKGNGTSAVTQAACADLSNAGTACAVSTGTSGATVGLLNGNLTFGGIDTFLNSNVRMIGSSTGYTIETNLNASALNFTWSKPPFNGTYLGYTTGSPPTGGCLTLVASNGPVTTISCGGGGSSLTVDDGFGNSTPSVATLTLIGLGCPVGSGAVTCITTSPPRLLGSGVNAYTIQAADMGNEIVLQDNSGGTLTVPVVGSGLWQNGQTVLVCNESTAAWTITVASGSGAVIIEPSNPASIPGVINNIPACVYLASDGANLHPFWGGGAPNEAFLNQAQTWTAAQRGNFTSPAISTATFTPVIGASQNYRINLVHASCPCTLANPSGTLVAGQQGVIEIAQSATGSDLINTYGSVYRYAGGTASIALSTTASAVDLLPYAVDSTGTYVALFPIVLAPTH